MMFAAEVVFFGLSHVMVLQIGIDMMEDMYGKEMLLYTPVFFTCLV